MRNVAITGQGVISSLGHTLSEFLGGLEAGRIQAERPPWADETGGNVFYAPVKHFDPEQWMDQRTAQGTDRFAQFGIAAAAEAVRDSGLDELPALRTAVVMGTSMAGAATLYEAQEAYAEGGFDAVPRKLQLMAWPNMAAGHIALRWQLHGPLLTVSTACASSLDAIGIAARMIETGMADVAIAGGTDNGQAKVSLLGAVRYGMSPTDVDDPHMVCRPFDKNRRGVMGGDGAACVVLERLDHAQARGARIAGMVRGYGSLSDGFHPSSPDPSGEWEVATMRAAQHEAGLAPSDVGAVIAHGTGTAVGDAAEIAAINRTFVDEGAAVEVTSIKGTIGHAGGAAGVMNVIAGLHALETGSLVPTASTTDLDDAIKFRVPLGQPAHLDVNAFQANAFGFGGQDASLVVARA